MTSPAPALWLLKSEPETFGWPDLVAKSPQAEPWDGVRNHQARNMLAAMRQGEQAFFYHSGRARAIVGICKVTRPAYPDPTADDPRWLCVDVQAVAALPRPVTLQEIKAEPALADMALVRAPRLSVQPVAQEAWERICAMGGLKGT